MDSRTLLDYALFQLTPTRTRCDLVIFAGGKNEKLASGLVEPFISHLQAAKDQIPKGGYSITLRPPNAHASWFTKATFQRVVRFISTPEILERFVRIEREIVQIEGSIRSNELSTTDAAVNSGEGSLSAANDVTKGSPDPSKVKGETGKKDVPEDENSKICLQRTLETRKVLLRKEQAMAYARALVAGFDMVNNDDLMLFSDAFGAKRLREACLEFKDLCKKKLTDTLWMDELAAMAACPPSELPYLGTSGIILTSEGNNTDGELPVADQTPSTPAKVQVHLPWQNQIPPYMYNYQNSVQGFPYPGMQPVPPYYPGHMQWSPNMDDSGHRHRRRSSSRKKGKSSETSSEEEQVASGDSDDGTEPDAVKKHDGEHSSGEKPITRKHRKKSSKTVVIRNINYITSDKRNGEKGGDSEDDSSVNGELIDEEYLRQKVQDAVGSLEKHRKSRANKNKGTDQHNIENGMDDFTNGDSENVQSSGGKHSAWDALQNLLMREDESAYIGNKEEHFGNSNTIDLGNEKSAMRKKTTANDSFVVSNRAEGNIGRGDSEDFANAENMRSLMSRGETVDAQLLVSRNLDGSGQRTVSDFITEPSTIKKASGDDWFVMNQSTISENQGQRTGQTIFDGDYALSTDKEKSKTVPAIDDSFMVQTRTSADENSQWRTDISMMEGSNVVPQSETNNQDVSHAKSVSNSFEPDDFCVMVGRDSGLSPGASWAPEMDYETEISFTKADKKSAPVELTNDEPKPPASGKKTISKKPVGPGTKSLGRETRSSILRGSLATSRSDILSKSKSRPMINKSKLEKEEEIRKRMEDLVIERQKRIAERSAASPAASKRIPAGTKKTSVSSVKDQKGGSDLSKSSQLKKNKI
ncbi:hypothetical protein DCAR_0831296 [Daucus carota subsp. sativus]|uniref:COP1-interacting protein 7 n=1 Tax=Daucus carota subsp. sativus TaxID=79200 RepID=A0A175YMV3_DAUCS|nr:PREDICTED: uncharacterized protein LOC108197977 isoform X2 [Daucus carota subsp. sativus]WOH11803.1 hypothetical protein DCAR_0831296 [Daucus carota subsp. sativus]